MWRTYSVVFGLFIALFIMPTLSWTAKPTDRYDCHVEKGGKYVCDRGPLAGKTFASKKGMMEALRRGSSPEVERMEVKHPSTKSKKAHTSIGK